MVVFLLIAIIALVRSSANEAGDLGVIRQSLAVSTIMISSFGFATWNCSCGRTKDQIARVFVLSGVTILCRSLVRLPFRGLLLTEIGDKPTGSTFSVLQFVSNTLQVVSLDLACLVVVLVIRSVWKKAFVHSSRPD